MSESMYPVCTPEVARHRKELAKDTLKAWHAFSQQAFADGAIPAKTKQLIAIAVAHVTQCPYCIDGHARQAVRQGCTDEEIMEAVWVAAEMRSGGAYAHSALALQAVQEERAKSSS